MAKETFYFSHDYTARADGKIKAMIHELGIVAYGIYWCIIEDLYLNTNVLPTNYSMLASDYKTTEEIVLKIVSGYGLFKIKGKIFFSESVQRRLDERKSKSKKAKESAENRWGFDDKRIKAKDCILYIIKIFNQSEEFIKVGITSESVSRRYSGKLNNYDYELIYQQEMPTLIALRIEREINKIYKGYVAKNKFAGYLECYNINDLGQILDFAMQQNEYRNAIKESKVKESKVNIKKEIDKEKINFKIPEIEEVKTYFLEKKSNEFEAKKYWNFYESKNWMVGKNKMKNWQAAASGWISRNETVEMVKPKIDKNETLNQNLAAAKENFLNKFKNEGNQIQPLEIGASN